MSTTRVYIRPNLAIGGIDLAVIVNADTPNPIVRQWGLIDYAPASEDGAERIADRTSFSDDQARALYEALAEHYGHGTNDTRNLRRDYDAERGRVDKLTNAIITIATKD